VNNMNEPVNGNFGQQNGQQNEQPVSITLGDLSTLLQIIDVCSQRGGFQGQELAGVGMLRNKVETYLRQNAPQQQQDSAAHEQSVDVHMPAEGELADKVIS
tara:strand:+ start:780 stop:1082 length:303 start_codon:yes stop_codon:yes gene_type:complete